MKIPSKEIKLVGLRAIADHHNKMLESIVAAAVEITKEPDGAMGHTADFIYGGGTFSSEAELLTHAKKEGWV